MAGVRVLFLGMPGRFSRPPLEALLTAAAQVVAVWLPGDGSPGLVSPPAGGEELRVLNPYPERNIVHVAWEHGIPVYEAGDLQGQVTLARELRPDVMAVACWNRLIPRELREIAKLAVNVHPSLLPEGRGPAPVFWAVKLGLPKTGVTVHVLDDRADAGPILAQREVPVPNGIEEADLELRLAQIGGELLVDVLSQFETGTLRPIPQDESRATYHPRY